MKILMLIILSLSRIDLCHSNYVSNDKTRPSNMKQPLHTSTNNKQSSSTLILNTIPSNSNQPSRKLSLWKSFLQVLKCPPGPLGAHCNHDSHSSSSSSGSHSSSSHSSGSSSASHHWWSSNTNSGGGYYNYNYYSSNQDDDNINNEKGVDDVYYLPVDDYYQVQSAPKTVSAKNTMVFWGLIVVAVLGLAAVVSAYVLKPDQNRPRGGVTQRNRAFDPALSETLNDEITMSSIRSDLSSVSNYVPV